LLENIGLHGKHVCFSWCWNATSKKKKQVIGITFDLSTDLKTSVDLLVKPGCLSGFYMLIFVKICILFEQRKQIVGDIGLIERHHHETR
jgi:hypothetical protein